MGSGALCLGTLWRRPVGSGPPSLLTTLHQLTSSHTHITYFLAHSHHLLPHCLILYIHSLTYEPHGHIYYTHLTPLNSLNSSHSPHLTQPISFTFVPTSTVSFSDVFLFSVPFSVLNLCLIKLLTCGVIRSYNLVWLPCWRSWAIAMLVLFVFHASGPDAVQRLERKKLQVLPGA